MKNLLIGLTIATILILLPACGSSAKVYKSGYETGCFDIGVAIGQQMGFVVNEEALKEACSKLYSLNNEKKK